MHQDIGGADSVKRQQTARRHVLRDRQSKEEVQPEAAETLCRQS